jgi:hypothetical protein
MLLQDGDADMTAMVAAIPHDEYPLLLCLTVEHDQVNAVKVIQDLDDTLLLDAIYLRLIEIQERFDGPSKQILHSNTEHLFNRSPRADSSSSSQLILLDQQTEEFLNVANYFTDCPGRIIRVERIENEGWLTKYKQQKKTIYGHYQTERILFHGCLRTTSQQILRDGFCHEFIGIHGNTKK